MKIADFFDLFTPVVVIPLYWLLFRLDGKKMPSMWEYLLFMVFSALWVLGQGMHLAANSIGHLLKSMESSDAFRLTSFYDETLSHYLWHFGVISLSGLIMYRQWRNSLTEGKTLRWLIVLASIIYGFTFFAMIIEGVTWPLGLPFGVLAVIFTLFWGRKDLSRQPTLLFFTIAYSVSILLLAIWAIWQHGLPEFSTVGII